MRRGTTPTITARIKELPDLDIVDVVMLVRQGDILIKKGASIEDNVVRVNLSQEETYRLVAGREMLCQLKITVRDGSEQGYKVLRSDIFSSLVKDALDDEVVKALDDVYDEYIWVNNKWELIGTTSVDLSGYLKASELVELTTTEIDNMLK